MLCLLQPPRGGLLAAMEAHKMAEGDPFPPPPIDPLHSFQVKLNCPPCIFEDVEFTHKFDSSK